MARLIEKPTIIAAVGNEPKRIEEFVGYVNTHTDQVRIARTHSSPGWEEPGQTPAFDEFTLVLAGMLRVETQTGVLQLRAGQAVHAPAGG
jgi:quercetin dioxygenase-like cupin family protein